MCLETISAVSSLVGAFSKTKTQKTETTTTPTITSGTEALEASNSAKRKAGAAEGYQSTIKTSSSGDQSTATTGKKVLLGG